MEEQKKWKKMTYLQLNYHLSGRKESMKKKIRLMQYIMGFE